MNGHDLILKCGDVIKRLSCEAPVAAMCTSRGDSYRDAGVQKRDTVGSPGVKPGGAERLRHFWPIPVVLQRCSHRLHITHIPASLRRDWVYVSAWEQGFERIRRWIRRHGGQKSGA
jgi:hypothetical protein